jgi:hypothetical protein
MEMTILLPLLVAIVGALVYALSASKMSEIGRLAFATGLLVTLMHVGSKVLRL